MTPNKRIALNVIATYGRSLYAMVCGLLTSRWALNALGEVDYGLYGVIGGLTVFVCFLNSLMAAAVSHFFAYSIGEADRIGNQNQQLEDCVRWFNVSIGVHCALPIVLLSIGYPCGVWTIENFLTIPFDRIDDAIYVWRFTCLSAGVAMATVPFSAMYNAKQEIAELTIYGVITTTLNVSAVYYMVSHPGIWLKGYSVCMCFSSVLPLIILSFRAHKRFPECRFEPKYMLDKTRMGKLLSYAGATACGLVSQMLSIQGVAIIVNKYLGPVKNATLALGNNVSNQSMTFAGSFTGALRPAITSALGAGNDEYARNLAYTACQLSGLAFLIFMLPLTVEIDSVLTLWLKTPPDGLGELCVLMLIGFVLDRITDGHWMIIFGYGKIFSYQVAESIAVLTTFIFVGILLAAGRGIESVGWAMICAKILRTGVNIYYGYTIGDLSMYRWLKTIALPLIVVSCVAFIFGKSLTYVLDEGLFRIVVVTGLIELVFIPLVWFFVFDANTRDIVMVKMKRIFIRNKNEPYSIC